VLLPLPWVQAVLGAVWSHRRCFVCDRIGLCAHREPAVELAIQESVLRAAERKPMGRAGEALAAAAAERRA
jgi:hypothetical protein